MQGLRRTWSRRTLAGSPWCANSTIRSLHAILQAAESFEVAKLSNAGALISKSCSGAFAMSVDGKKLCFMRCWLLGELRCSLEVCDMQVQGPTWRARYAAEVAADGVRQHSPVVEAAAAAVRPASKGGAPVVPSRSAPGDALPEPALSPGLRNPATGRPELQWQNNHLLT